MIHHGISPVRAPSEVSALATPGLDKLEVELVVDMPVLVESVLTDEVTIEEDVLGLEGTKTSTVVVLVTGSMLKLVVLASDLVVPPLPS